MAKQVLATVEPQIAVRFFLNYQKAGAQHYLNTGVALPESALRVCDEADAILFGAMLLSTAMLLDWLADRHDDSRLADGAALIEKAIENVFAEGQIRPMEFGGPHGSAEVTRAIVEKMGPC